MSEENNVPNVVTPKPDAPTAPVVDISAEWRSLTPEQVRELERARAERVASETALEQLKQANAQLEKETGTIRQQQAVRDAFRESGVKFHKQSDVLTLIGQIDYDVDGTASVDGVPLTEAIQKLALDNPSLADGRSLRSLQEKKEARMPRSKADFATVQDKVAFINTHGADKFAALPTHPRPDLKGKLPHTWAEYQSLSLSERAKVAGRAGASFIAELHQKRAVA